VLAYKFLGPDEYGLLSDFTWPVGSWVEVEGPLIPALNGIHGCDVRDLAHWIDEQLWKVDLAGELERGEHTLVASRGRLVERVSEWNRRTAQEFRAACTTRCGSLRGAEAAATWTPAAGAAYVAAHAAGLAAQESGGSYVSGFEAERLWQSDWLAERLGLAA
jgi:hypothetical protein